MDKKDAIAIRLRDIKKIYKMGGQELAALNGINLDIKEGNLLLSWDHQALVNPL